MTSPRDESIFDWIVPLHHRRTVTTTNSRATSPRSMSLTNGRHDTARARHRRPPTTCRGRAAAAGIRARVGHWGWDRQACRSPVARAGIPCSPGRDGQGAARGGRVTGWITLVSVTTSPATHSSLVPPTGRAARRRVTCTSRPVTNDVESYAARSRRGRSPISSARALGPNAWCSATQSGSTTPSWS